MSVRGSQTSMRSFTLKPTEPGFLKTNRSAWTPNLDPKNNHKLFQERISLITHWHDKWNEKQRKQLLVHLLQRTGADEMFGIREWIMDRMPEPQWRVDPSTVLPKWLMLYVMSFLTTADLCRASQVSSHWQYLSEQDILWRHRTAARGWYLPYNPPHTQHGAWKQYYVMCVRNAEKPCLLAKPEQEIPTEEQHNYSTSDLQRLSKYFVDTEEPLLEPEPPSRILERRGDDEIDLDKSLLKEKWNDPNKTPKDLDNWGKITSQEYKPDIKFYKPGNIKSKSYTRLQIFEKTSTPVKKTEVKRENKLKSRSTPTITEIYTSHGSFRVLGADSGEKAALVTKKGIAVPNRNYWLQKPDKPTIQRDNGDVTSGNKAGSVGCGAVWGENFPCHAHPRVLLISSDVPVYEMIVGIVVPGVIGLVYDAEKASLRSLLNQVEHSLNGRKAESVGVFAPGRLGYLNLTRQVHVSGFELHTDFWKQLSGCVLESKFGGRIDIFSSVGVSTVNQTLGLDIVYRLTAVTSLPFNAPIGGIYGEWAEICGNWLLHPDNLHPVGFYLREDQIRGWVMFANQLEEIAQDMNLRYRNRLQIQNYHGLHRIINAIIRQGVEVLPSTEHPHLADILMYALSKLTTDQTDTRAPPQETEKVKRGVLCMRLVDVLLSSQFVKDLEGMKQDEEDTKDKEEFVDVGKDTMVMLEWMKRSVPLSLQNNSHRLIYPKGAVVDQRMAIVEEIIRTERDYIRNLATIDFEMYQPLLLLQNFEGKAIMNPAHLRLCFSDMLAMGKVHPVFLERLENKQTTWTADQTIGDVFLQLSQRFDCYSNYISNYPSAVAIFRKNLCDNPAFWGFVQQFEDKNARKLKLFELLSVPMNRIKTLKTLCSSLVFYTPKKHSDLVILQEAESEFKKLVQLIEDSRTQYRDLAELKKIETQVKNCPILTDRSRAIIAKANVFRVKSTVDKSGAIHTFPEDNKFPHYQKFRLFLFDDALLITKITFEIEPFENLRREVDNFVNTYALSSLRVKNTERQRQFVLYSPKSVYLFEFSTHIEMTDWVEAINKAIQNAPKLFVPNVYVSHSQGLARKTQY